MPARLLAALALACVAFRPTSSFVTGPAAPRVARARLGIARSAATGLSLPLRARWTLAPLALRMAGDGPSSGDTRTEALLDVISESGTEPTGAGDDADGGEEGSFRKRRAEKRRKAAGGQVSSELRFKLLEEQASPFRRFRQFFYAAAAGSASIGTFIAGTRVIAGLQGISGVQPLDETIPNTAINAGVVVVAGALWYFDEKRGQESLSELKGKSSTRLALDGLTVEDRDGDTRELLALRDDLRLVVLAGTAAEVTRAINLAARQAEDLVRCQTAVVPFFTDLDDDSAGWDAMKSSSPSGKWDAWLLRPQGRDAWKEWLLADKAAVAQKSASGKDDSQQEGKDVVSMGAAAKGSFDRLLRVYVIRKDGKIGARTVGPPAWPKLVKQIEALPAQDQYGTP